ncbi:MAG TPA: SRPBCC family protein [Allosphingosinicella sp.]
MTDTNGLELSITRIIDAPREIVWRAWTERLEEWFAPRPWTTRVIEQDFRPGGRSAVVMTGPNGETSEGDGVFLEVTPNERIVFTDAFKAGWVPQGPFMVGVCTFEDEGNGKTRYTVAARHWTDEAVKQHQQMGFEAGWSQVMGQLAEIAEEMARG